MFAVNARCHPGGKIWCKRLFNNLYTKKVPGIMLRMARGRSIAKTSERPKTVQRTYRFDTKTFEAFEEDCARHLANPKRVIEALILHWLNAGPDERASMAKVHRERIGASSHDEE